LSPSLVLKNGKPFLAISVPSGDLQDQATLQLLLAMLDFEMDGAQAMGIPRFYTRHHIGSFGDTRPRFGNLRLPDAMDQAVRNQLETRGHDISMLRRDLGGIALVTLDQKHGRINCVGDAPSGQTA
jgi:gamma-glutamyltranspeptidase/glutathione hydrolase